MFSLRVALDIFEGLKSRWEKVPQEWQLLYTDEERSDEQQELIQRWVTTGKFIMLIQIPNLSNVLLTSDSV